MALTHHNLFQICFPPASSPTFPHFQALFPPSCSVLSSITVFSLPFIFTWLFLSACCTTLSQPNGIASEHVSLSLLSTTPALIARKLMKQRTRLTPPPPSSFCFVAFLPFAQTPFPKYPFSCVPLVFFPWLDYYFSPTLLCSTASQYKSFIIYLLGISFDLCFFWPHLIGSVCT